MEGLIWDLIPAVVLTLGMVLHGIRMLNALDLHPALMGLVWIVLIDILTVPYLSRIRKALVL